MLTLILSKTALLDIGREVKTLILGFSALIMPIKDDNNLLNTINSHIKLRKLKEKHLKVCEADALKQIDVNVREEENKNYSSLYYSNSNSNTATRKTRIKASQLRKVSEEEELAKTKKEKREKELDSLLDSDNYCLDSSLDINSKDNLENKKATTAKDLLTDAYILYFKELLSNNSRIFANAIGIGKTRAICNLSDLLALQFCFFSNSLLENIGRLTKEKAIEMQINTTNAISKALAAANKLIILEANTPTVHSKATKHYLALLRIIIRKGGSYIEKRAILLSSYITFNATNKRDSVTSNCIYKIEDARNIIANIKHNASEHELSYKDILEKKGLNKLEASRRNLFTNLSKNYFLSITAEDVVKAANILLLLKEVCAKILIESYKLIVQVLAEMYVGIVYFNLDSKLELKVLDKQDVKTTS
ncbi:hypothetical protein HBI47_211650 [Parastagonospora nodorum]|nr:hypothetical protein HBI47_211650 [Parastagonospora nodorum]